jgi:NAD(P)-dependent dehydrogenase (short-subunit alcohol dehydrogenase family)
MLMSQDQDKQVEHQKVAIVTGSPSGIGKETALTLAKSQIITVYPERHGTSSQNQ